MVFIVASRIWSSWLSVYHHLHSSLIIIIIGVVILIIIIIGVVILIIIIIGVVILIIIINMRGGARTEGECVMLFPL